MDALVEMYVFRKEVKWIRPEDPRTYDELLKSWSCGVPYYSTDLSAAWRIVTHLKNDEPEISWISEKKVWHAMFWKKKYSSTFGHSAPYVICWAGLRAVGVDV